MAAPTTDRISKDCGTVGARARELTVKLELHPPQRRLRLLATSCSIVAHSDCLPIGGALPQCLPTYVAVPIGQERRDAKWRTRWRVLTTVANAGAVDASLALDAAVDAGAQWAATPSRARSEVLRRAFDLLVLRTDDFARSITAEMGKPLADARAEVGYAADFLRWFAEEAVRIPGRFTPAPDGTRPRPHFRISTTAFRTSPLSRRSRGPEQERRERLCERLSRHLKSGRSARAGWPRRTRRVSIRSRHGGVRFGVGPVRWAVGASLCRAVGRADSDRRDCVVVGFV
jgi:hypothetical protein